MDPVVYEFEYDEHDGVGLFLYNQYPWLQQGKFKWLGSGTVDRTPYTWPPHVAWGSSQPGCGIRISYMMVQGTRYKCSRK